MTSDEIMRMFRDFTHGTRVTMLINRGIQNSNKGSKRWVNKLISHNMGEFERNLHTLIKLQHYINDPDVRLCSCVNKRNLNRSITTFQHAQLDLLPEQKEKFYSNLHERFCSALMKPENKNERLFLIDFDDEDTSIIDTIITDPLLKYKTPNGWHYITKPFNPIELDGLPDLEIKKDALLLLNTLSE